MPVRRRHGVGARGWLWLLGPIALYAVLRVPSFLEPHWYTDEAGYVATARAVLQGRVLYSQVWTNKPPLQIWTIAAAIQTLGTSEAALHAVTFLTGLISLLAVAYAGRRLLGPRRTVVALLLAALLLGTPLFDAELLLPESLLIAPVSWAGALLLTRVARPDLARAARPEAAGAAPRGPTSAADPDGTGLAGREARRWPLWPAAVGVLMGVAVGYQQTALAETCVFGLIVGLSPAGSRLRRLAVYTGAFAVTTALWLVPSVALAGLHTVISALVGFWVPFTEYRYTSAGPGAAGLLLPAAALALLVGSAWLLRRERSTTWGLWLWAAAALLVPAVARQPYPHYLLPSMPPATLALCSLGLRSTVAAGAPAPRALGRVASRLSWAGLLAGAALAAWGGSVAGVDWISAPEGSSPGLVAYYGGALSTLFRQQPLTAYQETFNPLVAEDSAVATWISDHGLDGSSAVVWSIDAWLYTDSDLRLVLPTPPIYNDETLMGESGQVAQRVAQLQPELVITEAVSRSEYPDIDSVLMADYTPVFQSGGEIVWVLDGAVSSVLGSSGSG